MLTGCLAGLSACALWGFTFVLPHLVPGWGAADLTVWRYAAYGAASLALLLLKDRAGLRQAGLRSWLVAIGIGGGSCTVYYLFVVAAVDLAGVALTTLVIGTLPVTLALSGRLVGDRTPLRQMAVPLALVSGGLAAINLDAFAGLDADADPWRLVLGLLCAVAALASWNGAMLWNAHVLKTRAISSASWASFIGLGAALSTLGLGPFLTTEPGPEAVSFGVFLFWALGSGLACSFLGGILWNVASRRLPVSLCGFLIVGETVFGLCFGFLFEGRLPRLLELAALGLIVAGVGTASLSYGDVFARAVASVRRHAAFAFVLIGGLLAGRRTA